MIIFLFQTTQSYKATGVFLNCKWGHGDLLLENRCFSTMLSEQYSSPDYIDLLFNSRFACCAVMEMRDFMIITTD